MPTPQSWTLAACRDVILRAASCGDWQPVFGTCRVSEGLIQVLSTAPDPVMFQRVGWVNPDGPLRNCRFTLEIDGRDVPFELDEEFSPPEHVLILAGSE